MSLWTLAMLISYAIYSWVRVGKLVPPSVEWAIHAKGSVVILSVVVILAALAILFPSPKHDRLDMFVIVAIAVIGEEILFRGLLWDIVEGRTGSFCLLRLSGTVWLTALAFGVMHFQYHQFQIHLASGVQVLYSLCVGLILGGIRERTGSVIQPILVHSAFNSLFNLMLCIC
jgi:membrane protease YdiL (CAAX protease family)